MARGVEWLTTRPVRQGAPGETRQLVSADDRNSRIVWASWIGFPSATWWPDSSLADWIGSEHQGTPDGRRIAIQQLHVIVDGPADKSRAGDLSTGTAILLRVATVHMQSGAVVLKHGPHCQGIVDRTDQVVVVLLAHG